MQLTWKVGFSVSRENFGNLLQWKTLNILNFVGDGMLVCKKMNIQSFAPRLQQCFLNP